MPIVAWYMLSKESYMKRVIREVFPTAIFCQRHVPIRSQGAQHTTLFAEEHQPIEWLVYAIPILIREHKLELLQRVIV